MLITSNVVRRKILHDIALPSIAPVARGNKMEPGNKTNEQSTTIQGTLMQVVGTIDVSAKAPFDTTGPRQCH